MIHFLKWVTQNIDIFHDIHIFLNVFEYESLSNYYTTNVEILRNQQLQTEWGKKIDLSTYK